MGTISQVELLAQQRNDGGSAVVLMVYLLIAVVMIAGMWKTFAKAGKQGWAALVPIFNFVVLLDIAERPIWWLFLLFIPIVNLVVACVVGIDVAKRFGKGEGFGIGLALLGFIFYPILGFGSAQYQPFHVD